MSYSVEYFPFNNNNEDQDYFQQYQFEYPENQDQISTSVPFSQNIIYEPEYFLNPEYFSQQNSNHNQKNSKQNQFPQILNSFNEQLFQNNLNEERQNYEEQIIDLNYHSQGSSEIQSVIQQFNNQYCMKIEVKGDQVNPNQSTYQNQKQQQNEEEEQQIIHNDQFLQDLHSDNSCNQLIQNSLQEQQNDKSQKAVKGKKQQQQNQFKNIVNAFKAYYKKQKYCDFVDISNYEFSNLKKQLMRYMKVNSFNHSLLKYLINHKFYKLMLLDFLQKESQYWIESSKMQDKQNVAMKVQQLTEYQTKSLLESKLRYKLNKIIIDQEKHLLTFQLNRQLQQL